MDGVLKNIKPFEIENVPVTQLRQQWLEYKRSFMYAAKLLSNAKKRMIKSLFLTLAGRELQRVYETLQCGHENDVWNEVDDETEAFDDMILQLDGYFTPKQHETFERYSFWNLKPGADEPLDKFLLRAKSQANSCQFGRSEAESREIAIIDKVVLLAPPDLRKKILERSHMTVESLTQMVNSYFTVQQQVREYGASESRAGNVLNASARLDSSSTVNRISNVGKKFDSFKPRQQRNAHPAAECSRCGYKGHSGNDTRCPALDKTCNRCGIKGHFERKCFKAATKRSHEASSFDSTQHKSYKRPRINAVEVEEDDDEDSFEAPSFVHAIGENHDELLWAKVGSVLVEMMIDSGTKHNIIDYHTWLYMKNSDATVFDIDMTPAKPLKAYAQERRLEIACSFRANLHVVGLQESSVEKFYVVVHGTQNLLGRITAKKIGVLKLGLPSTESTMVNLVHENSVEVFPKFKGE